jgi:flavin-dependent dehydrogenase
MSAPALDQYDVAIIGGGPGGSTTGSMLKKYNPGLNVLILEKERFPREHVGESQLPPISDVLAELGCWDKVEAANFPIKVGATFRWGKSAELWDFEFLPLADFKDEPRPAKYEGQRRQTAFQVDRSMYDDILLRHARELGCEVCEETQVVRINHEGDRVTDLQLRDGSRVRARHFIDASGHVGVLRRAMGVGVNVPTKLQNIAIWDYWDNAEWAVKIGVGGTRIQVMSLKHGWLWFIPLGPTHTSLGFVCPAEHYKSLARSPEDIYLEVVRSDERIAALLAKATRRGPVRTTKDWSFVSDRTVGENWFLVGEAAGFADPILSAGLTLTHTGARELAYTILELDRGSFDRDWLTRHYDMTQRARVGQHIRFADFWYACNGQLTDLQAHCQEIAKDAGLRLTPQGAWRWIAQGGFANDILGQAGIGGFDMAGAKQLTQMFTQGRATWLINDVNVFRLNLTGADETVVPIYDAGRITEAHCLERGGKRLVLTGLFELLVDLLRQVSDMESIYRTLMQTFQATRTPTHARVAMQHAVQCLEVMLTDGWVIGKLDKKKARLSLDTPEEGGLIHWQRRPGDPTAASTPVRTAG